MPSQSSRRRSHAVFYPRAIPASARASLPKACIVGAPQRPRKGGWGAERRCVDHRFIQGPYFNVFSRFPFSFVGVRSRRSSALPVPHYCTATQGRMGRRTGVRRTAQLKSKVDTHAPERRVPQSGASAGRSAHRRESRARGALRRGQHDRFSLVVLKVF